MTTGAQELLHLTSQYQGSEADSSKSVNGTTLYPTKCVTLYTKEKSTWQLAACPYAWKDGMDRWISSRCDNSVPYGPSQQKSILSTTDNNCYLTIRQCSSSRFSELFSQSKFKIGNCKHFNPRTWYRTYFTVNSKLKIYTSLGNRPASVSEACKPHHTWDTSPLIFLLSGLVTLAASKQNMLAYSNDNVSVVIQILQNAV